MDECGSVASLPVASSGDVGPGHVEADDGSVVRCVSGPETGDETVYEGYGNSADRCYDRLPSLNRGLRGGSTSSILLHADTLRVYLALRPPLEPGPPSGGPRSPVLC